MGKDPNQRKTIRQKCHVPVDAKAGTVFDRSKTLDISQGGIGFLGRGAIPLRKKIAIEIQLTPDSDPILAWGQVCWSRRQINSQLYRFGLKFSKFLSGSLRHLKQIL